MEQIYDNLKERLEEILLREHEICSIKDDKLRETYRDEYVNLIIEEDEIVKKIAEIRRRKK